MKRLVKCLIVFWCATGASVALANNYQGGENIKVDLGTRWEPRTPTVNFCVNRPCPVKQEDIRENKLAIGVVDVKDHGVHTRTEIYRHLKIHGSAAVEAIVLGGEANLQLDLDSIDKVENVTWVFSASVTTSEIVALKCDLDPERYDEVKAAQQQNQLDDYLDKVIGPEVVTSLKRGGSLAVIRTYRCSSAYQAAQVRHLLKAHVSAGPVGAKGNLAIEAALKKIDINITHSTHYHQRGGVLNDDVVAAVASAPHDFGALRESVARALKGLQPNNLNEVVSFSTTPVRDLPFYRKLNIPAGRALNFKPLQVTQEKWLTQYDAVKAEQLSVAGYLRRGRLDADTQKKLQDYQIELNRSEADLTSMANDLNDLTADNVKLTHLLNQANKKLSEGLPRRPIEILLKYQGQSERFVNGLVGVEQANGEYRLTYDHTIACSLPFSAWVDNVSLEQAAVDTEDWKSFTPIGSFTLRYDGNNPYVPLKHGSIDAREKARTKDGAVELHFIQRWQSGGVKKGFVFNDKNDAQPVIRTFYQGVKSLKYRFVIVDTRGDRHYVPFENLNIESAKAAAQKAAAKK